MKKLINTLFLAAIALTIIFSAATAVEANHSWGGFHWARTANPFTLKLGDNVSPVWDSYLSTASTDWTVSSVLDTSIVGGQASPKTCKPVAGRVEICNSKYGKNGWLGIASVWINGSHITQGTVKMNDTYFLTPTYNTPAWRNLVLCQEIGHTFGLDHQDENFENAPLGSCMDYSSDPSLNQHPNLHDYEQLELIYAHTDTFSTISQLVNMKGNSGMEVGENASEWGRAIRTSNGKPSLYERDLGKGQKVYTFVIWAE